MDFIFSNHCPFVFYFIFKRPYLFWNGVVITNVFSFQMNAFCPLFNPRHASWWHTASAFCLRWTTSWWWWMAGCQRWAHIHSCSSRMEPSLSFSGTTLWRKSLKRMRPLVEQHFLLFLCSYHFWGSWLSSLCFSYWLHRRFNRRGGALPRWCPKQSPHRHGGQWTSDQWS